MTRLRLALLILGSLAALAIGFTAIPWRGRDDPSFRAWPEIDSAAPVTGGVR